MEGLIATFDKDDSGEIDYNEFVREFQVRIVPRRFPSATLHRAACWPGKQGDRARFPTLIAVATDRASCCDCQTQLLAWVVA